MTGRTHDLAAFTALNIIVITNPLPEISLATALVSVGACFIGGLTPDIDTATSDFWDKIPAGSILGKLLHPFLGGHRMISHSILGIIIIGFITNYLFNLAGQVLLVNMELVWMAFMIGVISHIIMDSFTEEGVPLLFPIPFKFGIPPIKQLRIHTGGLMEKMIVFPGLLLLNGYLFYKFYPIYLEFFHQFIK